MYWSNCERWKGDVAGILFLSGKGCCARSNGWRLVAYGNVAVDGRVDDGDIRLIAGGRELAFGERKEGQDTEDGENIGQSKLEGLLMRSALKPI